MKVLQIPSWYLPEGGQFCLYQSQALIQEGLEVDILANVYLPWRKYKWKLLCYPLKAFFCFEHNIQMLRNFMWRIPMGDTSNIQRWANKTFSLYEQYASKYGKPDIIHVHSGMWAGLAAAEIKKRYGVPYVITEHRGIFGVKTEWAKSRFKPKYKDMLEKAYSNANHIIAVSPQQIGKLKEYAPEVSISWIPNILDTEYFAPIQRKNKTNEAFRFISVNGFNPSKGYEFLIPAFDIVCNTEPNTHLRIVGEEFERKEFQALLAKCKNKDKISFAGEVQRAEVREELYQADAFVIASRVEAQSVATVEAMSTGLPVVGTDVTPEEILSKECGYIVPVEDIPALAEGMIKMIQNKAEFDGMKIAKHVKAIVSPSAVTKQIIRVYEQVL